MKRVAQEDGNGCPVACVAMLAGVTYQEVKSHLPGWDGSLLGWENFTSLLKAYDFQHKVDFGYDRETNKRPDNWPEPFAPAHVLCIETRAGGHFVVWLPDGTVLDPARPHVKSLDDCRRYADPAPLVIFEAIGVFPQLRR